MQSLDLTGIDLDGLAHDASALELPPVVPGRVVHIDADFLAYQCSAEKADGTDTKTLEDMKHNAGVAVRTLRDLAGAESVHLHLTPSTSDKGQRYTLAILKEYQANRADKEKPRYLNVIRNHLAQVFPGTLHQFCEADDGMSSSQYASIASVGRTTSVIASKDKDLSMVPGLHLDWDRGCIHHADTDFGTIWIDEKRSASGVVTKKLRGLGQKFFWAQLLMGDPADNISGIPKVPGDVLNVINPTKAVQNANLVLKSPNANPAQKERAQRTLDERKAGACGPVITSELLKNVRNNKQAFEFCRYLYQSAGEKLGFVHWQTLEAVPWQKVFVSEMQLLWMRRNKDDPNDVIKWLGEVNA